MLQKLWNFKNGGVIPGGSPGSGRLDQRRRFLVVMMIFGLIAALTVLTPLLPASTAQGPVELQSLANKARQQGQVRVIVSLNVPFQAEGRLAGLQEAQQQRQMIQRAQGSLLQKMAGARLSVVARFNYIPAMTVDLDAAALAKLAALPEVSAITEDKAVPPLLDSSIPIIGADRAWAAGFTGKGQTVVILDTGVDKTHPFFTTGGNKVVSEACYSSNNPAQGASSFCPGGVQESIASGSGVNCPLAVSCQHGAHVAGIAAGNDGLHAGVAREANLIAIQVFSRIDDSLTPGAPTPCADAGILSPCILSFTTDQIKALERVFELRNDFSIAAVNMSLGGGQFFAHCDNNPIKAAIDNLRAAGIATVIASGNNGFLTSMSMPACVSSAISVGATDDFDNIASFSNVTSFLSLLAPGVDIYSSVPGGGIGTLDGTSMATPHVAGAWAVMKQKMPGASVDEILAILQKTGKPVDDRRLGGIITGLRRINLAQALGLPDRPETRIYLPIILPRPWADLVVDCICGAGLSYTISRTPDVDCPDHSSAFEVTIRNQGDAPITESFWVDAYFNPTPVPTGVNHIWDDGRAPYGLAWGVSGAALPLEPGETLTLTSSPFDPYLVRSRSKLPPALLLDAAIYAQVDSANLNTTYGGVLENHEAYGRGYNNLINGRRDFDPYGLEWLVGDHSGQPKGVEHLPARPAAK